MILEQIHSFQTAGEPVSCARYGNGHINETYLVEDSRARQYILQKINKFVFKDPTLVMENVSAVTRYLKAGGAGARECLSLVPTDGGADWTVDGQGEFWRMYDYISDSACFEAAQSPGIFQKSGEAFGRFQLQLADFPSKTLNATIPRFHDTPNYYRKLRAAIEGDPLGRAAGAQPEIGFALAREDYAGTLERLRESGEMPLRVTHNDTKLNNILFDRATQAPLCVIDLDTVMPGLSVNDFGDSIRFGASTAAEDEPDLSKVAFSPELFAAYAEGFLSVCGNALAACEIEHLCDGAKMMTLECGVRFLADYIGGDPYFHVSREGHNLDRCRTQFKLVAGMEAQWGAMRGIVQRLCSGAARDRAYA
jgi:Ser/Thr protein kinase RdoA (MazF antagonist)